MLVSYRKEQRLSFISTVFTGTLATSPPCQTHFGQSGGFQLPNEHLSVIPRNTEIRRRWCSISLLLSRSPSDLHSVSERVWPCRNCVWWSACSYRHSRCGWPMGMCPSNGKKIWGIGSSPTRVAYPRFWWLVNFDGNVVFTLARANHWSVVLLVRCGGNLSRSLK